MSESRAFTARPARIEYTARPAPDAPPDWVIENVGGASFMHEVLLEATSTDRRVVARKIRQQRRKLRRVNAEFGHGPSEGVPEALLRVKVRL